MRSASDDFGRDHGLIHEIVITGRKAGWGKDEWSKLAHNEDIMRQIGQVLRGKAIIEEKMCYHIVLNVDPKIPEGESLIVAEHIGEGAMWWNEEKIRLHRFPDQESEQGIAGWMVRRALPMLRHANLVPLNANVLDYLLANQHLIPEEWKKLVHTRRGDQRLRIYFFGSVYRNTATGYLDTFVVRYLEWHGDHWHTDTVWIGSEARGSGNYFHYTDAIAMMLVTE